MAKSKKREGRRKPAGAGRAGPKAAPEPYRRYLMDIIQRASPDLLARIAVQESRKATDDAPRKKAGLLESLDQQSSRLSFAESFPIAIHDARVMDPIQRYPAGKMPARETFDILEWIEGPKSWWTIAREALKVGMRLSIAVPRAFAVDVAAIACQAITEVPLRVSYDEVAGRLVFRHADEEAIHEKQEAESEAS